MDPNLAPQHLDAVAAATWTWMVEFLPRAAAALAILAVGALWSLFRWDSPTRPISNAANRFCWTRDDRRSVLKTPAPD